jgi:deferrochelatase/peroxidase EfeB
MSLSLRGDRYILMRRWRTGAPVDLAPLADDPSLGADPSRNNNFRYDEDPLSQTRCPFAAHTRKTNPRADLDFVPSSSPLALETRRIIRRGILFGPEVSADETASCKTTMKCGLLFMAY